MNSKQFRKQLKQASGYPSPTAFYTAVLLRVGHLDKWGVWQEAMNVIDEALPIRLATTAHTRFMNWYYQQKDATS